MLIAAYLNLRGAGDTARTRAHSVRSLYRCGPIRFHIGARYQAVSLSHQDESVKFKKLCRKGLPCKNQRLLPRENSEISYLQSTPAMTSRGNRVVSTGEGFLYLYVRSYTRVFHPGQSNFVAVMGIFYLTPRSRARSRFAMNLHPPIDRVHIEINNLINGPVARKRTEISAHCAVFPRGSYYFWVGLCRISSSWGVPRLGLLD